MSPACLPWMFEIRIENKINIPSSLYSWLGGTCLSSQHLGGRGRRTDHKLKTSQGYVARAQNNQSRVGRQGGAGSASASAATLWQAKTGQQRRKPQARTRAADLTSTLWQRDDQTVAFGALWGWTKFAPLVDGDIFWRVQGASFWGCSQRRQWVQGQLLFPVLEGSQLLAAMKPVAWEITPHWLMGITWFGCLPVSAHPAFSSKLSAGLMKVSPNSLWCRFAEKLCL